MLQEKTGINRKLDRLSVNDQYPFVVAIFDAQLN